MPNNLVIATMTLLLLGTTLPGSSSFQFPRIKFVVGPSSTVRNFPDDDAPRRIVREGGPDATADLGRRVAEYWGIVPNPSPPPDAVEDEEDDSSSSSSSSSAAHSLTLTVTAAAEGASSYFRWEPHVEEGYDVAHAIFEEVARYYCARMRVMDDDCDDSGGVRDDDVRTVVLSFPSMKRLDDLVGISRALNTEKCRMHLGLQCASFELYPTSPAPILRIVFADPTERRGERMSSSSFVASSSDVLPSSADAASATENWVNDFLGKYRLCPYTRSIDMAAVGLSSVGVPAGRVRVRVASTDVGDCPRIGNDGGYRRDAHRAAELVLAFWSEVRELLHSTEELWSTTLVVFPEYDDDFALFSDVCDAVIEPIVEATKSTEYIGRAWFHPGYDADVIGHVGLKPGHAIPHRMVEGFVKSQRSSSGMHGGEGPLIGYEALSRANDRVRQTPHATINILRRSQLLAAGMYESGLGSKKPKPNSIYVRNALRLAEAFCDR